MYNLEYLDNLPKRMGIRKEVCVKQKHLAPDFYYDYNNYKIIEHVSKRFLNKEINSAYSYFCKKIRNNYWYKEKWRDYYEDNDSLYYVDEQDYIKINLTILKKDYNNHFPKTISSPDFKVEYRFKEPSLKVNAVVNDRRFISPHLYERIIIQGVKKVFDKPCKEYYRWKYEKKKANKKQLRENKAAKKLIQYNFLTKKELSNKFTLLNTIKLELHGMDKTNFRGIEYHGGKRKRAI